MNKLEKQEVLNYLAELNIDYQLFEHAEVASMDDCKKINKIAGAKLCKNLFLQNRQGTEFYLLLMDGDKRFKTAEVSKKINKSRLSFGTPKMLSELLNEYGGAINPLGLIYDKENSVNVIIDKTLLGGKYICFHPMVNTASVKIKTDDFICKFLPKTKHTPIIIEIIGN